MSTGTDRYTWTTRLKHAVGRWRGLHVEWNLDAYQCALEEIRSRSHEFLALQGDGELVSRSLLLRERARSGEGPEALRVEAYALVCAAAERALGLRPFDEQLMAAVAMSQCKLVEMPTGEGKTLVGVFPAYLHALAGGGVHVFTANDYLAKRDALWMGEVYRLLGMRVDFVQEGMTAERRRQAYGADITYLTAREAGFDFLRDHLLHDAGARVHRPFHFAIVDEADFILIDEARVPLIIAGEIPQPPYDPLALAAMVRQLIPGRDYSRDDEGRNVYLTEEGMGRIEALLGCGNLYAPEHHLLLTAVNLALHARALLTRDVDYIVSDGRIELIDAFTGRVADRRRWPDGIQQAVEAKEGISIQPEGSVLGSITLQHFIHLYPRRCGMTATAVPAAEEFFTLYGLATVVVPPHRPCIRRDDPDLVFTHRGAKMRALEAEIARVHATGRPILVGTASVQESEMLTARLIGRGIRCRVLNAKNDEEEAGIVADAGRLGALTISTNMAGRGTDILLGGREGREYDDVVRLGGLYVIGTNRHESLRIDLQLRGRAGRQGDPGSSRFFVSLEDDLLVRYGIDDLIEGQHRPSRQEGPCGNAFIGQEIDRAQRIVEDHNSQIRQTLFRYSLIMEDERQCMHAWRDRLFADFYPPDEEARELRTCLKPGPVRDERLMDEVVRRVSLHHLDQLWSEHLAWIADLRESIHLVRLAGKMPLDEFQHRVHGQFCSIEKAWLDRVRGTLDSLPPVARIEDLEEQGYKAPSSTWTYLVNDNPFSELYGALMLSRNIGFAAGAAAQSFLILPLLLVRWLLGRLSRKRRKGKPGP